ncbi:MAG: hypothetical protein WDN06_14285 [Asticcacaulis sp.]
MLAPALILALCVTACNKKPADAKGSHGPAPVGYIVVSTQPLDLTSELSGRTSAWLVSDVRPQVGGIVKARQFTPKAPWSPPASRCTRSTRPPTRRPMTAPRPA